MVDHPSSPFSFQAVAHALAAVDVFKELPSVGRTRALGISIDHLNFQYEARIFASRGGSNTPFWQRWTAAHGSYTSEDTVSWAERFLRQEFELFCQQTDPQAQERDRRLHRLCHVQTGASAPPEIIVRIEELCFLPGVIFPWVTAHAVFIRRIHAYNRALHIHLDALDRHLGELSYFFINHPAPSVLTEQIAYLRQLLQEAEASFPNIDAWKRQLGLDKKFSREAHAKQRIWTPLFKELVDLLRPFCRGPKKHYWAKAVTAEHIPQQAFDRASRLMHLSHPELWDDHPDLVKSRYYALTESEKI